MFCLASIHTHTHTRTQVMRTQMLEMLSCVLACLGRPCMTDLDEQDLVEHEEYRQAVTNVRSRVLDLVRKAAALEPLPFLKLASASFLHALEGMAANTGPDSRQDVGEAGARGGHKSGSGMRGAEQGVAEAEAEAGEAISEADAWLKMLEVIVDVLPPPLPPATVHPAPAPAAATQGDRSERAATAAFSAGFGADAAAPGFGADEAAACEGECATLVANMLQAGGAAEAPEAVAVLVLRALGMFTHLYNRAPDNLIGSVVAKVLESIRPQSGPLQPGAQAASSSARSSVPFPSSPRPWPPGAASSPQPAGCGELTNTATPRRRICMGVLHKIASACGTKLAVHIDQLSSMIGGIVQQLAPGERGVMTGKNIYTNQCVRAHTHTHTVARTEQVAMIGKLLDTSIPSINAVCVWVWAFVCLCMCACARAGACVRACVCACVRAW